MVCAPPTTPLLPSYWQLGSAYSTPHTQPDPERPGAAAQGVHAGQGNRVDPESWRHGKYGGPTWGTTWGTRQDPSWEGQKIEASHSGPHQLALLLCGTLEWPRAQAA